MGANVPTIITERIIAQLEKGFVPWQKTWKDVGMPRSLVYKTYYHGINVLLLSLTNYSSPWWATWNQIKNLGGTVKEGEEKKYEIVVFYKKIEVDNMDPMDEKDRITIPFLRYYRVYNTDQCEGLELPQLQVITNPKSKIEICEEIIAGYETCPKISYNGSRAYYSPREDIIGMPKIDLFNSSEDYYSALFHEMVHSTGHSSRLDRKSIKDWAPRGSEDYSQEELVAEIGAVFLTNRVGIEKTFDNSVAYLQTWLQNLKNDHSMIIRASSWAQKATDYITKEGKYEPK